MLKQKVFGKNFEHVLNQRYVTQHLWVHHPSKNIQQYKRTAIFSYDHKIMLIIV